jgi:hypothetical protein
MADFILKAFVLCDRIADSTSSPGQRDLFGAGLNRLRGTPPFPIKRTFWVYVELADEKTTGNIRLSVMRADSARRLFFRIIPIQFPSPTQTTIVAIRVFECIFPAPGVYFIELWYDDEWVIDQRIEVV